MTTLNTYMELPHVDGANDSDVVLAFGYMDIKPVEIGHFVLARQFRDHCDGDCSCDLEFYNPAFLMCSDTFSASTEYDNKNLNECIQLFETVEAIGCKIVEIKKHNLHNANDLIIYQIIRERDEDMWVTFKVHSIQKQQKC